MPLPNNRLRIILVGIALPLIVLMSAKVCLACDCLDLSPADIFKKRIWFLLGTASHWPLVNSSDAPFMRSVRRL
jgi:hypothetical protein